MGALYKRRRERLKGNHHVDETFYRNGICLDRFYWKRSRGRTDPHQ
jgi:hypothetical protein